MRQCHLVIMVKEPCAGRVKTRLGKDIGHIAAAWWFRHQTARLIRRLSPDRRWRTVLAVSPDNAVFSRWWPANVARLAQGQGDLGARMNRAIAAMPPGPVVVIGADIPEIRPDHIVTAFRALGRSDAVFGPATDGGYWLVGLARKTQARRAGFLENVRWSGPHALADSIASLGDATTALIDALNDVDTAADL